MIFTRLMAIRLPLPAKRHSSLASVIMSKLGKGLHPTCFFLVLCLGAISATAQSGSTKIAIKLDAASRWATVTGTSAGTEFRLLDSFAGNHGLASRIRDVAFHDLSGSALTSERISAAHYRLSAPFSSWTYRIDLTPLPGRSALSRISSFDGSSGVLMLADILPQLGKENRVELSIDRPTALAVHTLARPNEAGAFLVDAIDDAVFYLGSSRAATVKVDGSVATLLVNGNWLFTDEEASTLVRQVLEAQKKTMGSFPSAGFIISISPFNTPVNRGEWEGDVRGGNLTLVSSDMPFRNQSLQRLHEQLRHETFHFWFPAGVSLTGSYDWFYEGFALYAALRMGVDQNRIRFEDMLDTLSRAYQIDRRWTARMSLIEMSRQRWSGSNTQVYARGMLVAFLCDLALLAGGRADVGAVIREIYTSHKRPASPVDGNTALVARLKSRKELVPIAERYVTGSEAMDMSVLHLAGLVLDERGAISVLSKRTRTQDNLLDKLGYNNWRKAHPR
jgi:predicted metalloprotease with PDZ domain